MRAATLDGRLEAVAGPPEVILTDPNGFTTGTLSRAPFDGMTLILVYDANGAMEDSFTLPIVTQSGIAEGRFGFRFNAAGSNSVGIRVDMLNGISNRSIGTTGGRTPRRHIGSARIEEGLREYAVDLNGRVSAARARISEEEVGGGIPAQQIRAQPSFADGVRVAAFAWPRFLTDEETLMVHHWLALRYNVPIFGGGGELRLSSSRCVHRSDLELAA